LLGEIGGLFVRTAPAQAQIAVDGAPVGSGQRRQRALPLLLVAGAEGVERGVARGREEGLPHRLRHVARKRFSIPPREMISLSPLPGEPGPLALAVSPGGAIHLDPHPSPEAHAPAGLAQELADALARGAGPALLQLAARHPGEPLPPSAAFFRDVAALYLA